VAAADVLDERVPGANHLGRAEPFEPTHRSQSGLEPNVIGFDGVVRVVLHDMARRGQQFIEHPRVRRSSVGAHLGWAWAMLEGAGEERASGRQIPMLRDEDVDDVAMLVDRPVQIDSASGHFHIGFIDEPPITRRMPARPGRINQQRGEPLHPAIDGDVVDRDAALGQQLFHVAV
jgi:hypothetical protein